MKDIPIEHDKVDVFFAEDELRGIRSETDRSRKHFFPLIRKSAFVAYGR